jgi:hypothetical protein
MEESHDDNCEYPGCTAKAVSHYQYANGPYETFGACEAHEAWALEEKARRQKEWYDSLPE